MDQLETNPILFGPDPKVGLGLIFEKRYMMAMFVFFLSGKRIRIAAIHSVHHQQIRRINLLRGKNLLYISTEIIFYENFF